MPYTEISVKEAIKKINEEVESFFLPGQRDINNNRIYWYGSKSVEEFKELAPFAKVGEPPLLWLTPSWKYALEHYGHAALYMVRVDRSYLMMFSTRSGSDWHWLLSEMPQLADMYKEFFSYDWYLGTKKIGRVRRGQLLNLIKESERKYDGVFNFGFSCNPFIDLSKPALGLFNNTGVTILRKFEADNGAYMTKDGEELVDVLKLLHPSYLPLNSM
jgi:hypothetical protein